MAMLATFKRQIGALESIFGFIEDFFEAEKLEPKHRYVVDLALEEAFTNMVRYNPKGHGDILITLDRNDDELVLSLTDFDSMDFDLTKARELDVDRPIEERDPGGLGIHLIRKMMDKVEYERNDREGTIIMTKKMA